MKFKKGTNSSDRNKKEGSRLRRGASPSLNTTIMGENSKYAWVTRWRAAPVSVVAVLSLLSAMLSYGNYSIELDKNRQKTAYLSDLRQLSERIEKSALLVRSADERAFDELNASQQRIDQLLTVLKNGGKLQASDANIDPMKAQFTKQFNSVQDQWIANRALVSSLFAQKTNLVQLKKEITQVKNSLGPVQDNSVQVQKLLSNDNRAQTAAGQELLLLSNRIQQGFEDLFSGESFSLEKGYSLVKDLRVFQQLTSALQQGDYALGITPVVEPQTIAALTSLINAAAPLFQVTEKITPQIENLSSAKEVAKQVSGSSRSILLTAENLNNEFASELAGLSKYRNIAFFFFFVALLSTALLGFIFYERSLQAQRAAQIANRNQANENAVSNLLNQITPLDEGDFSQKVYVDDKFVLPISERIDATRKRFGNIVRQVKFTSDEVLAAAQETEQTSQKLLDVSNQQYQKMGESIGKIGKLTSDIDELSQITWIAQEESKTSQQASVEGDKLVRQSISKMDEIRHTIQESSKKIKKLGESAQSITEVTVLIQDITKQINVLALNAAIQAASSGESGREFTIVAQEVQRLAFDSENATRKIGEIINEIQHDTALAVASMEKTTQEVVAGAQLTDRAGSALKEIEKLASSVAERIAEASGQLEQKSEEIANFALEMKSLQDVTENSSETIKVAAGQVESLKAISQKLDDSVNIYKVD